MISDSHVFYSFLNIFVFQQQQNLGQRFCASRMHLSLPWLVLLSVQRRWFCCCWFVVDCYSRRGSLNCCMFCYTLLYVHSSFAIILMGELIALLGLSSWCLVMVVWLFLALPWVCLLFVILVFPDHTHLLFLIAGVCINISHPCR